MKECFSLYIDVMSTGKSPVQSKEVEALLKSKGIGEFKLEEKKSLSSSSTLVFSVTLKTQDQGLKMLSIDGSVDFDYLV